MQTESRCRGEKRRHIRLFGLVLPAETRGPDPRHVECLSVQVGLAFRCLDRDGSFLDNQHRAKPTRWSTPTRVEVEGRTHGSHARRARPFRQFADTGANLPSAPHGCPGSAVVQDQRAPRAVWRLHWAFGRAPERRPALGHAACSHEVSGWKAELERRKLLERHSRQPGDDLHRRRDSSAALTGFHVPLPENGDRQTSYQRCGWSNSQEPTPRWRRESICTRRRGQRLCCCRKRQQGLVGEEPGAVSWPVLSPTPFVRVSDAEYGRVVPGTAYDHHAKRKPIDVTARDC